MSNDIDAYLTKIRSLVPKLNIATDEAAARIKYVENSLREMGAGIAAECEFDSKGTTHVSNSRDDEESPARESLNLVYERIGSEFKIGVATEVWSVDPQGCLEEMQSRTVVRWESCDRGTKLKSVVVVPKLLSNIAEELAVCVEKAKQVDPERLNEKPAVVRLVNRKAPLTN